MDDIEKEIERLETSLLELRREAMRRKGGVVLLCSDSRYGCLHEETDLNIVAEGILTAGSPHMLYFTYDNLHREHLQARPPPFSSLSHSTPQFEEFSDSEGEVEDDMVDEESQDYEVQDHLAVPLDACAYSHDLPSDLIVGKSYGFFVLSPP